MLRISHSTITECNGAFRYYFTLTNDGDKTVATRASVKEGDNSNIASLYIDKSTRIIPPGNDRHYLVTGDLVDVCKKGFFWFEFAETTSGPNDIPGTQEVHDCYPLAVPCFADESLGTQDPVVASPAGEFEYEITVNCCSGKQLKVKYSFETENISFEGVNPPSPMNEDCDDLPKNLAIKGILTNPNLPGKVYMWFRGIRRCVVKTDIVPNPRRNAQAHQQALRLWRSGERQLNLPEPTDPREEDR